MNQIFITNPKGGCGKTTIATQLAGYYAKSDHKVLLVDHDAQKSSSDWHSGRPKRCNPIQLKTSSKITPVDSLDVDYVIHDMPAAWTLEHVEEILHSDDKVLIPILSSPTDIKAVLRFIIGLNRTGILETDIQIGLIANRVKTNTRYAKVQRAFLDRLELPIVGTLRDTQNYIRAMDRGVTIFDLPPSMVKQDLSQWQSIVDWLE